MLSFGRPAVQDMSLAVSRPKGHWVRLDEPEVLIGTGFFRDEIAAFALAAGQAASRGRAVGLELDIRTDIDGDVTAIMLRGTAETRGFLGLRQRTWDLGFLPAGCVSLVPRDTGGARRRLAAELVKLDVTVAEDPVVVVALLVPPDQPRAQPGAPRPAPKLVLVR